MLTANKKHFAIAILLSFILTIVDPHLTEIKSAKLTPAQTSDNGARILYNIREVTNNAISSGYFDVRMLWESTWQFIIIIPPTLGFDGTRTSSISLTLDMPPALSNTASMNFGFTSDNQQYISTSIKMDGTGRANQIYPQCDQSKYSTARFGQGDIASIPTFKRSCDIAGGSCINWRNMLPSNNGFAIQSPITLTLENDPLTQQLTFYFDSPSLPQFEQKCKFGSHFVSTNNGLKVYVAGDSPGQLYSIKSFDITTVTRIPTTSPTEMPSITPTKNPTTQPTISPTNNPSIPPTISPTRYPTNYPTNTPTKSPTKYPTISPTNNPSITPSKYPSISPSKYPTTMPSKYPSNNPSYSPTKSPSNNPSHSPSNNPSQTPSKYPTNTPSISPTKYPTTSPSYNPTITPTNNPSNNPSITPTYKPSNNPSITPTYNPSITPSNYPSKSPSSQPSTSPTTTKPSITPTNLPSITPTNIPTSNPNVPPTNMPTNIPSTSPIRAPTNVPSKQPTTIHPTNNPSNTPTNSPTTPTLNPSPQPTFSPIPQGYAYGAYKQLCKIPNQMNKCQIKSDTLIDTNGGINCAIPFDCCMCNSIECGITNEPCNEFQVTGNYGAYGVQNMHVSGDPYTQNGVSIDCQGVGACYMANIHATHVSSVLCDDVQSCANSSMTIIYPKNGFVLECAGSKSCEGLNIDIIFPPWERECPQTQNEFEFSKILCNSANACEGLDITIKNQGCNKVIVQDLECTQGSSCNNAKFDLIGDVTIDNCNCGSSCNNAIGLDSCFENLYKYVCGDPHSCQSQAKTITNPRNGFEIACSSLESCRSSQFVININNSPSKLDKVDHIKSIVLGGTYSAKDSTFIFNNKQIDPIDIYRIQCSGYGSCDGTTFILGPNVGVQEVICAQDSCANCIIKQTVNSPGVPCDPSHVTVLQI